MANVKSGQAITPVFGTFSPTTGAATNADSLPTGTIYVNGVADAATVTVTNLTTGRYKAAVTLPALTAGDTVSLWISATVGGVAGGGTVWSGIGDTKRTSDTLTANPATDGISAAALAADAVAEIQSGLATASALASVSGFVDTEVAAILAAVDTEVAAIKAKTDLLPTDPADQSQVEAAITSAQGALSTAIGGLNDLSAAQVTAIVAAGDDATLAAIAALNNLSSAQAQAAAAAALAALPVPLIADIEAAIAAGSGATPETFWNYIGPGGRTLTQSMIAILSSLIEGSAITITRGDTVPGITISGLGNLEDRTRLWFTVKARPSTDTDAQSKIQITEDGGLLRLNGAAADDSADGALTVDDEVDGDVTITLSAAATAQLGPTENWRWDIQVAQPGPGVWTPRAGVFLVEADVTRATE